MTYLASLIVAFAIALPIIYAFVVAMNLYLYPDFHPWPSVTRCRLCEKRVFAWQRKERRAYHVQLDNPDGLLCNLAASGIVHKHCKGTPVFEAQVTLCRH